MNIYDVSKKAGVSIATVSRVLNGNQNVSDKTKDKVLSVMKELGYTPNVFARGLGLNTMHTIGILCSDSSDAFLANAVYYIEQALRKNGYESFLCCTGYELENKKNYLRLLLSKRVDAVILVGSHYLEPNKADNDYIISAANEVPVMMINGYLNHPNIYCTLCDDYQAVYDTVGRIASHGKKDFMFLYRSDSNSSRTKIRGFRDGIEAAGLTLAEDAVMFCPNDISETKEILLSYYREGAKCDAILTSEDSLAVAAVKFAGSLGLRIPQDLEIVGYNNSLLGICTEPELSTLDNHVETLSITTVNTLMRVLQGADVPNKTTISNDFIVRGTAY
ncbi:MAG: LacI family DNA-binding transcriptional regulator [Lachnospiraceae bacterium]|nr:LacI family DNA-binding transcriptional regulator [Lachnospiraceae bacterium]